MPAEPPCEDEAGCGADDAAGESNEEGWILCYKIAYACLGGSCSVQRGWWARFRLELTDVRRGCLLEKRNVVVVLMFRGVRRLVCICDIVHVVSLEVVVAIPAGGWTGVHGGLVEGSGSRTARA